MGAAIAAIAKGATVIEKHFTLSHIGKTVDSAFSLNEKGMKNFVEEINNAWEALGKVKVGPVKNEKKIYNLEDQFIHHVILIKGKSFLHIILNAYVLDMA